MPEYDVSVVIVNYNSTNYLLECLRSMYANTKQATFEVIVVDNASSNCNLEPVENEFPEVVCISNKDNRGFAGANNQAIALAKGRNILLLNPDTIVRGEVLHKCCEYLDENQDVGGIGCRVLNADETLQTSWMPDPTLTGFFLSIFYITRFMQRMRFSHEMRMDGVTNTEVDAIVGCYLMIPRRVIDDIGALDDKYFLYSEDHDWCTRARKNGWKIMYTPVGDIIHYGGGSERDPQFWVRHCRAKLRYFRIHRGQFYGGVFRIMLVPWLTTRLLVTGLRRYVSPGRSEEMKREWSFHIEAIKWALFNGQ
jgi:GT2 family glycosyltransferase